MFGLTQEQYDSIAKKAFENAPEWLLNDIEDIIKKEDGIIRISFVISELFNKYTFNLMNLTASMHHHYEWTQVSRERLSFIDNNIDLIQIIFNKKVKHS